MFRIILIVLFTATIGGLNAQTKGAPANKNAAKNAQKAVPDTVAASPSDTIDQRDLQIKASKKFAVYTKRPKGVKDRRAKLCINLVSGDTTLNHCFNDTTCRDPEVARVLFERKDGDTTYVLVFADAFTKIPDMVECASGKETKLFFVRWNTSTNKALWKTKTISSCLKGVTNMTNFSIAEWDGAEALVLNYYRGGTNFVEIKFDPQAYKLGFQTVTGNKEGE